MPHENQLAEQFARELPHWPEGRLPTVRDLAMQYAASTRTVQAALKQLCNKGIIESRSRSGFWRLGEVPQNKITSSRLGVGNLASRFKKEILEGIYPWDSPLPLIKELATQWNCHPQTVTKVLELSIQDGLLERRGRLHFPLPPKKNRVTLTPTILCLGAGAKDGHFRMDSDRESDFWRELGIQAGLAGVSLVRRVWNGGRISLDKTTIGVIATSWHYPDPIVNCKEISKLKVPACVWFDEHILTKFSVDSGIGYHDQGHSTENGILLARYLIELGHTHLAFISPWHANQWSIKRLKGIEEEATRQRCRVEIFCLYGDSEWDRLVPAQTDPVLLKNFPAETIAKIIEGSSSPVWDFISTNLGWNRIRKDMVPLFEKALSSGATAWIGANDICALNALSWLREQSIPVPQHISVAGFDDTTEALRSDLTSFRFSSSSVARSMIYQILTSNRGPTLTRHKGMVVVRGTTSQYIR
jgi:DNA-binding transcriptional regulator YhcF (GntR family)